MGYSAIRGNSVSPRATDEVSDARSHSSTPCQEVLRFKGAFLMTVAMQDLLCKLAECP